MSCTYLVLHQGTECAMNVSTSPNLCSFNWKIWVWCLQNAQTYFYYKEACDWGIFKKPELNMKSPVGPIIAATERALLFLSLSRLLENVFPKKGKYSIVNKSTTFAPFCHPYLNPLFFTPFLQESQQWKFWKVFSEKPEFW